MGQFTGKVQWFNNAKGYGFLSRESGADVFIHFSALQQEGYETLKEGDSVKFDVVDDDKDPQADDVKRLKRSSMPAD